METTIPPVYSNMRWLLFIGICAISFCIGFTSTSVMMAVPIIHKQLNISPLDLQWMISAYVIAAAAFIVIAGQLGDRLRRRRMLYVGAVLFVITSAWIAFSSTGWQLILGRFVQGIAAALLMPNCLSLVKVNFPEKQVKLAMGIWAGVLVFGFGIGPLGGGAIVTELSWRAIFLIVPIIVLVGALILAVIPKVNVVEVTKITILDLVGLVLLVVGLMSFFLGLVQGNAWGWLSPWTLVLLIGGFLVFVLFCWYEKKVGEPLVNIGHFKNRNFVASVIAMGLSAGTLNLLFYFFNIYAQTPSLLNYTAVFTGVALLPTSISVFMISFFSPMLVQRFGHRWVGSVTCLIAAIGFYLLTFVNGQPDYSTLWLPLLLIGLSMGCCFTCMPSLGMLALPDNQAGEASGIINTGMYFFVTLFVAIGTLVYLMTCKHMVILDLAETPKVVRLAVEKGLMGHAEAAVKLLQFENMDPGLKTQVLDATRQATLVGFRATMWLGAALSFISAILLAWLIRVKKEEVPDA